MKVEFKILTIIALAGLAQWLRVSALNLRVSGMIPCEGQVGVQAGGNQAM